MAYVFYPLILNAYIYIINIDRYMNRQMAKVVNQVEMTDEDHLDIIFWQSQSFSERLQEVVRLRKNYYTWLNGSFPATMNRIITSRPNDL
ncbi:MAG: hypothetical protein ABI203_03450 [Mucilaginibacter sp.]